ncbi:MAG: bifunctional indole-3-glycerol phosphate synthase/phosphoribosylanthranilate isomerase [Calditrichaeota bacterium]|nr:bifunctional indole-3-glycerol phosphate synthase/phosphoribosylanthranilate isomerase [Calditrichota bacterium]
MNRQWKKIRKLKYKEVKAIRDHFRPEVFKAAAYSVGSEFRSLEVTLKTATHLPLLVELKTVLWPEGIVLENFQPLRAVRELLRAGALAGAVVATDEHFLGGDPSWINLLKYNTEISVLQRDFYVDPVQVYKAKAIGADAVMIDLQWVESDQLPSLVEAAFEMGLEAFLRIPEEAFPDRVPFEGISGVFFPLHSQNGEALAVSDPGRRWSDWPDHVFRIGIGLPAQEADIVRLVEAGVHALLLEDRFWTQPQFLDYFHQLFEWTQKYPLRSDKEPGKE